MAKRFYHMHCLMCPAVTPVLSDRSEVFNYSESEKWCSCSFIDPDDGLIARKLKYAETDTDICDCKEVE